MERITRYLGRNRTMTQPLLATVAAVSTLLAIPGLLTAFLHPMAATGKEFSHGHLGTVTTVPQFGSNRPGMRDSNPGTVVTVPHSHRHLMDNSL